MTDAIPPALTPQEWDRRMRDSEDRPVEGDLLTDSSGNLYVAYDSGYVTQQIMEEPQVVMALANAALPDDSPYGISHADVNTLRDVLIEMEDDPMASPAVYERVKTLIAKLAALLPPE
ncbi:MAG: hypothetical protein ACR2KM_04150 [Gemmatimonadaceae bacterium]